MATDLNRGLAESSCAKRQRSALDWKGGVWPSIGTTWGITMSSTDLTLAEPVVAGGSSSRGGPMTDAVDGGSPALRFIVDSPADEDSLRAHSRVAAGIAAVLTDHPQIKTIGLLGGWGSGKSTVVRLVERQLANSGDTGRLCFVYDAWLRQSDPPRRAFLEGLIAFLRHHCPELVAREEEGWAAELRKLGGEVQTTTTSAEIKLTRAGRVVLPALLFMPLGWKLIGDGVLIYDKVLQPFPTLVFWVGWALTLLPLLAAGGLAVLWPSEARNILSVFTSRPAQVQQELKTRDPEPSAIEFQALFRKIIAAADSAGRRLVIIVDNLDRLPPDEALALWATIRSFFLGVDDGGERLPRAAGPAVLVPIDPSAPSRIHGADGGVNDQVLSQSFIEKTFDLVFHVPPPVLSGWQDYLQTRLREVFGAALQPDWLFTVSAIYEGFHRRAPLNIATTPRSLNSFANALGVLWLQWKEEDVSMASIAFFVCHRGEVAKDIYQAVQAEIVGIEGFDPDWRLSVAALHFGVPKHLASELYMGDPIRSALQGEDADAFRILAQVPGFDRYLDRVLDGQPRIAVTPAARTFEQAEVRDEPWAADAWRKLRRTAMQYLAEAPLHPGDAAGIAALIRSLPKPERAGYVTALSTIWTRRAPDDLLVQDGKPYAAIVQRLLAAGRESGIADPSIPFPSDPRVFVALLGCDLTANDLAGVASGVVTEAVITILAPMLRDSSKAEIAAKATAAFAPIAPAECDWAPLAEAAMAGVQEHAPIGPASVRVIADTYSISSRMRDTAVTVRDQGYLGSAISRFWSEATDETVSGLSALALTLSYNFSPPDGAGWTAVFAQRPALAAAVDDRLTQMGMADDLAGLIGLLEAVPAAIELLTAVARSRAERLGVPSLTEAALQSLPAHLQLIPPAKDITFWRELAAQGEFWPRLADVQLPQSTPLYLSLIGTVGSKARLAKALKARLETVSLDEWISAIVDGADPYPLANGMRALERTSIALQAGLSTALDNQIPRLFEGANPGLRTRWFDLVRWVPATARTKALKNFRTTLVSQERTEDLMGLLAAAGDWLFDDPAFDGVDDPFTYLVPQLLAEPNGLVWLAEHSRETQAWQKRSGHDHLRSARSQIEGYLSSQPQPANELLRAWFGAS